MRFENRYVFEETELVLDTIRANFRFGPPASPTSHAPHKSLRDIRTTPSVPIEDIGTATPGS